MKRSPAPSRDRPRAIAELPLPTALALVAVAYFAVAKLGLSLAGEHDVVSAVWLPAGVGVAAVVLLGIRIWPAIALGALLAHATGESSLLTAAGVATANALAVVAAGLMLARAGFDARLERIRDVVALAVLGAGVSTALSATGGVGTLWAGGIVDGTSLGELWRVWWLGDLTGVLLIAPAVLLAASHPHSLPGPGRLAEAALLVLALVAGTIVVLGAELTLAYPVFALLAVAALRFRQPGAVAAALIVSAIAVAFTARGEGPFALGDSNDLDLLGVQLFVALASLSGLLVAASRSQWERARSALERLHEGETALAEAQALAHVGSWEWEIEPDEARWSPELYRILGADPAAVKASYASYLDLVLPEDRALVREEIEAALVRCENFSFWHRLARPDGEVRTVRCRGRVLTDRDGKPCRMVGTAQDLTEQELAEERFRALLEAAPDAMVIVDEEGRMKLVNTQTEHLFGYRRDELLGRPVEMLMGEPMRGKHPLHRAEFHANPRLRPMASGRDLVAMRKDGTEFPVEISLSPLQTSEGLLVSSAIRDVTARRQVAEQLQHQALHDPLTGLPNRTLFADRLEQALRRARRRDSKLAVLFCDLDEFKNVNDGLGHEAGDELLAALPPKLGLALRSPDTIARFGGDEFVVLCEDLDSEADAVRIAKRVTEAFHTPIEAGGREHHLSISVGVVLVEAGAAGADEILRDADVAMYRAKALGKNRAELFDARMRARVVERLQTEADLRQAIDEGELRLLYQPVLSLESETFVGAEALLRWQHPTSGLLPPDQFLVVAEETGLLIPIGGWVLGEACGQAARWPAVGGGSDDGAQAPRISVNLSPRELSDPGVVELVRRTIEHTGIPAERLELEITETSLFEREVPLGRLHALREMGVRLILDDFGTGYSSLARLKHFPIDAMKLDRAFVKGLGVEDENAAIVVALLGMAQALGLEVTAEGVETSEQLEWLQAHGGCAYAQGFLLSPPLELGELEQLSPWSPPARSDAARPAS